MSGRSRKGKGSSRSTTKAPSSKATRGTNNRSQLDNRSNSQRQTPKREEKGFGTNSAGSGKQVHLDPDMMPSQTPWLDGLGFDGPETMLA